MAKKLLKFEDDPIMFLNFTVLEHNGRLIEKAIKTLEQFIGQEKTWIWIETPSGEQIMLKDGYKIRYAMAIAGKKRSDNALLLLVDH